MEPRDDSSLSGVEALRGAPLHSIAELLVMLAMFEIENPSCEKKERNPPSFFFF